MPLLLIPLLLLLLLLIWGVLLPLSLWQRFRFGKARRLARPWWVRVNAWLWLLSVFVYLVACAVLQWWFPQQWVQALAGLAAGAMLGVLGLALSRFERRPEGLFYTPNPWLILALTLLVAGRIVLGLVQMARQGMAWVDGGTVDAQWHAGLVAVAGVLLGYSLAYAWGLRWRLRR